MYDCWASYFTFTGATHVHLLRELQALIEQGAVWAADMKALLLKLYHATDKGSGCLSEQQLAPYLDRYDTICWQAQHKEPPELKPPRDRSKKCKGRNLCKRLVRHRQAVLAFAYHKQPG